MAPRQRSPSPPEDLTVDKTTTTTQQKYAPLTSAAAATSLNGTRDNGSRRRQESLAGQFSEADIARERHDIFNLVALIPIIVSNILNFDCLPAGYTSLHLQCFSGNYFFHSWLAAFIYFLVDLAWVARVPNCVKSPRVIVNHHLIVLVIMVGPIVFPEFRYGYAFLISVEVNTWFLVARRVLYKRWASLQGARATQLVSSILSEVVSFCFYATWIAVRCHLYPLIMVDFVGRWIRRIEETGIYLMHGELVFLAMHGFLVLLNFKWTYDLFKPLVKKWVNGPAPHQEGVSNGL